MSDRFSKYKLGEAGSEEENKNQQDQPKIKETATSTEENEDTPTARKKRRSASIEYDKSISRIKKNLHLPVEIDLAVKELKERRIAEARRAGERADVTEEGIILEALEEFFKKSGVNLDTLEYVLGRMEILYGTRK